MLNTVCSRRTEAQRQLPHVVQRVDIVSSSEHDDHVAFSHEGRVTLPVRRSDGGQVLASAAPADDAARGKPRGRDDAERRVRRVASDAAAEDNDDVDGFLRGNEALGARRHVADLRRTRRRRHAAPRHGTANVRELVPLLRAGVQGVRLFVVLADGSPAHDDDKMVVARAAAVCALGDDGRCVAADCGAAVDFGRSWEVGSGSQDGRCLRTKWRQGRR